MMTTQKQIRNAFWQAHEGVSGISKRKIRGDYDTDTRCAFVDYVDKLARDGEISEKLANRATL
jgi:hypothetical protein